MFSNEMIAAWGEIFICQLRSPFIENMTQLFLEMHVLIAKDCAKSVKTIS